MDGYTDYLCDQFRHCKVTLKHFDNGNTPESMALKIVVTGFSTLQLKKKGMLTLDCGNWIYRTLGLVYEMGPEFSNKGEEKNSLTFFISKKDTFGVNFKRLISLDIEVAIQSLYVFPFKPIVLVKGKGK